VLFIFAQINCFDLIQSFENDRVQFFLGDVTKDVELLAAACEDVDTVFHTASLTDPLATYDAIWNVNVIGTRNVLEACSAAGVRNLIYISTTAVIFNGRDINNLSEEQCPYPTRYLDAYSATKSEAEQLIIAANGRISPLTDEPLCTVSLRPHAIFGPRDVHFMAKLVARARSGDLTHRIGSGENMVDFTYIGNVIHACRLAMDAMSPPPLLVQEIVSPVDKSSGEGDSSNALAVADERAEGEEGAIVQVGEEEAAEQNEDGDAIEGGTTVEEDEAADVSPQVQFHMQSQPLDETYLSARARIGGQAMFITNGEPHAFWPFLSLVLNETGCVGPSETISFPVAYCIAWCMEWVRYIWDKTRWIHGRPPMEATITRHMVRHSMQLEIDRR
jgi:nucleoside-diphosphate-sugar epimerase